MTSQNNRCVLLLQGPLSKYYARTAHYLEELGTKTLKVHFCGSDVHDWEHTDAVRFSEPPENWALFLEALIVANGVTDILLHGDRRYYHKIAIGVAKRLDVNIIATELGYLRPDWMTVEYGGCSALSHFPQTKQELMALDFPVTEDTSQLRYPGSYKQIVLQELGFTLFNAIHARKFPHYRNHRTESRVQVYGGWLKARLQAKQRKKEADVIWDGLKRSGTSYYLFALQLNGDFQIRDHSPFGSIYEAIEKVIASFARNAPEGTSLLFKSHPLEYRFKELSRAIVAASRKHGVEERTLLIHGQTIKELAEPSLGMLTINSSAGIEALEYGVPTCCILPTIYDMDGLTHQGDWEDFWCSATPPEPEVFQKFVEALKATIQVRGTLYNADGLEAAAKGTAEKILTTSYTEHRMKRMEPPRLAKARKMGVTYDHFV
ncbi:capsular polysaccharide biosynthesis protein [Pseudovibrio japonicus]|uniref:Capsular polysaccharide biosynthesis protein n=1 Tax=Pseudovibrio japonicus TaxID=366534 RepID=A0ABQ3EIM5_9HYPH|nr:capsular biosynthesis protein [Pseudovibrio japonicus]GHB41118.1 capsular polysaccharide biosynthesis protein [Pseudovibrio japonicus]